MDWSYNLKAVGSNPDRAYFCCYWIHIVIALSYLGPCLLFIMTLSALFYSVEAIESHWTNFNLLLSVSAHWPFQHMHKKRSHGDNCRSSYEYVSKSPVWWAVTFIVNCQALIVSVDECVLIFKLRIKVCTYFFYFFLLFLPIYPDKRHKS